MHEGETGAPIPQVSVVIPARNGAATVGRAVASARQDGVAVEVVVVDDGSTDGTADAARAGGAGPGIPVVVVQQANAGVCAARNAGVAASHAPLIVFLDADDELLPGALGRYLDVIGDAPLARAAVEIDREGDRAVAAAQAPGPGHAHPRGTKLPGSFAISRELFDRVGGYDTALRYAENTELLLRVALVWRDERWPVPVIAEPAARIHRQGAGRPQRYGSAPADAARRLLDRHGDALAGDREILADYAAIIGTDVWRRGGSRREAARWFARAVRNRPTSATAWARLARTALPVRPKSTDPGRRTVFVVCPGVGRIARGYEAFAIGLAARMAEEPALDVRLVQGGPVDQPYARRVRHLDRHGKPAELLARITPFYPSSIEHYSFGLASLPLILRERPSVIILSERPLATLYGAIFRRLHLDIPLVLTNGGAHEPPFKYVAAVVHHAPSFYETALADPRETARHAHLPYGFDLAPDPPTEWLDPAWRAERRAAADLPVDRPVVISIGAADRTRKRMDHLVRELARLGDLHPYLLLLGQREAETAEIERLATDLLGADSFSIRTVAAHEVEELAAISDLFALASSHEGFGRVYVEAVAAGVPCVLYDDEHTRWVLGEHGTYVDVFAEGAMADAIRSILTDPAQLTAERRAARRRAMFDRYSWDALFPQYLEAFGLAEPAPGVDAGAPGTDTDT